MFSMFEMFENVCPRHCLLVRVDNEEGRDSHHRNYVRIAKCAAWDLLHPLFSLAGTFGSFLLLAQDWNLHSFIPHHTPQAPTPKTKEHSMVERSLGSVKRMSLARKSHINYDK